MTHAFLLGYDPGGAQAHGVALAEVVHSEGRWCAQGLRLTTASSVGEVVTWVEGQTQGGRLMAVGLDTLTEWNSGPGGWRPADFWLRRTYPTVRLSVTPPNALFGAMAINGAAFLHLLAPRFQRDGTQITEAHPKVLYHALTGRKHAWAQDRDLMAAWLIEAFGSSPDSVDFEHDDHTFDAALSLLPALHGLNGDWTLDLHSLHDPKTGANVNFAGPTHYWWPNPSPC